MRVLALFARLRIASAAETPAQLLATMTNCSSVSDWYAISSGLDSSNSSWPIPQAGHTSGRTTPA